MKHLGIALLALVTLSAMPAPASAQITIDYCSGYQQCYEKANDGYCVFGVSVSARWYCFECESCGNGPQIGMSRRAWLPTLP